MGDDIETGRRVCFDFRCRANQWSREGQNLTLDDNLSLNPNQCHHPLITRPAQSIPSERILTHFEPLQVLCCVNAGLVHKSNRKFTAYQIVSYVYSIFIFQTVSQKKTNNLFLCLCSLVKYCSPKFTVFPLKLFFYSLRSHVVSCPQETSMSLSIIRMVYNANFS